MDSAAVIRQVGIEVKRRAGQGKGDAQRAWRFSEHSATGQPIVPAGQPGAVFVPQTWPVFGGIIRRGFEGRRVGGEKFFFYREEDHVTINRRYATERGDWGI